MRISYAGSDCICGADVFAAFAAVPAGMIFGAGLGAVAATTQAAFSE